MIMTENDYDQLFRQLSKLKAKAPCHNKDCVGNKNCKYGIISCYGKEECAISLIQIEAGYDLYAELVNKRIDWF